MKNELKTIMFAALIAAMILPFSGMDYANADKQTTTPYTLEEFNSAMGVPDTYVKITDNSRMIVLEKQALADGEDSRDIEILGHWAKFQNKLLQSSNEGKDSAKTALDKALNGKFSVVLQSQINSVAVSLNDITVSPQGYWDSSACGITWGQTSHAHTNALNGHSGYSSLSSIQSHLVNSHGYYQVQAPWADPSNVGKDYGKVNTTGQGGCDDGEFRDQAFIYSPSESHPGHTGWHNLQHINEPNPDLPAYDTPTYWWNTYVTGWHYDWW